MGTKSSHRNDREANESHTFMKPYRYICWAYWVNVSRLW